MSETETSGPQELFVEIRCEELPARFVQLASEQLAQGLREMLQGVDHGALRTWATPRRIAVAVAAVAAARPEVEQLVLGPPAAAAFKDGTPTRAAEGFARGKGIEVGALEVVEGPRGLVIAARVRSGGERTVDLVAAGLEAVVLGIKLPNVMRWGRSPVRWARPLHGLIALYGGQIVPATVAGIAAGRSTLGHRLSPGPIQVSGADDWVTQLRAHHVEPDRERRRARIQDELSRVAEGAGLRVAEDETLVAEVTDLVEWPVGVLCRFDAALLDLPPRLLIESMRVHQRVFPLWRGEVLDHHFVAISNHPLGREPETAQTIAGGNAKVIGARFHDARFFFAEDRKKTLHAHDGALARMQWIRKAGSMQDKARRIARLAARLAPSLGADPELAERAGRLCKADLATQMVGEFPELQGHVGRLLAALDGEAEGVPLAIEEHYLPRFAGDALPVTPTGRAVALADRLDTLAGCFAAGIRLKGSSDPLGLRRAAHGLLQLLLDARLTTPPAELFGAALEDMEDHVQRTGNSPGADRDDLVEFITARLRSLLRERFDTELVDAVLLANGAQDPVTMQARVAALAELAQTPAFGPLKITFKRAMGLVKDHHDAHYFTSAFEAPAEQALHEALSEVAPRARADAARLDYPAALAALAELKAPVDRLFDEVMIMAEDPALRRNRLGLLRSVAQEFRQVADFTQLGLDAPA